MPQKLERIVVVGTSGSGKSTFARALADRLGAAHVELDALYWEPGWTPAELPVFRERVTQALSAPRWVVSGNYSKVQDLTWGGADSVVWLDYSFWLTFRRIFWRTIKRTLLREELWNGNRESFRVSFCSRESVILWMIQTHGRRRREYPAMLAHPAHAHIDAHRFQTPAEAEAFLANLSRAP